MDVVSVLGVAIGGWITIRAFRTARRESKKSRGVLETAIETGRDQPASLHPQIDLGVCIGCGGCVKACPEKSVLGLIDGQAHLIEPASCVGHGACAQACPTHAIRLVLGTEKRGVDIPELKPDFQSSVERLYVTGELGGMGLIRNAVRQGSMAVQSMKADASLPTGILDLVIVGAGPAGIAAALEARQRKLEFVVVEQEDDLGGSILHYPRRKVVLSTAVALPGQGRIQAARMGKEELLEVFKDVVCKASLPIRFGHGVERIRRDEVGVFEVTTTRGAFRARHVILAIGRRGTPQKLGVPGEELSKVAYRLKDPADYAGTRCLVVGGGDSALEAAVALCAEPATTVTLAYRGKSIWRAKKENLRKLDEAVKSERLRLVLNASPTSIGPDAVTLDVEGDVTVIDNDFVFIFAGGVLPKKFLESAGIAMKTVKGESLSVS